MNEQDNDAEGPKATRHLALEQIRAIAAKLRKYEGTYVFMSWNLRDTESSELAKDIVPAMCDLRGANWSCVIDAPDSNKIDPNVTGIVITVNDKSDAKTREAASVLSSALRAEKLTVFGPREKANSEPIKIIIGKMP